VPIVSSLADAVVSPHSPAQSSSFPRQRYALARACSTVLPANAASEVPRRNASTCASGSREGRNQASRPRAPASRRRTDTERPRRSPLSSRRPLGVSLWSRSTSFMLTWLPLIFHGREHAADRLLAPLPPAHEAAGIRPTPVDSVHCRYTSLVQTSPAELRDSRLCPCATPTLQEPRQVPRGSCCTARPHRQDAAREGRCQRANATSTRSRPRRSSECSPASSPRESGGCSEMPQSLPFDHLHRLAGRRRRHPRGSDMPPVENDQDAQPALLSRWTSSSHRGPSCESAGLEPASTSSTPLCSAGPRRTASIRLAPDLTAARSPPVHSSDKPLHESTSWLVARQTSSSRAPT